MKIERLVVGQLETNCYLVWDQESSQGVIIDPGDAADLIINKIRDFDFQPQLILATHGHVDHLLAAEELRLAFKIPFLLHPNDLFLLKKIPASARYWLGIKAVLTPKVDQLIKEGDLIRFGQESLKVIETPGHSPGSVCFYRKGVLFSGDTLFYQSVGRTDFSYGSSTQLQNSIKKLFCLPEKTTVYPGHGPVTTIEAEKESFGL